mgnify:CR=1 FL=1
MIFKKAIYIAVFAYLYKNFGDYYSDNKHLSYNLIAEDSRVSREGRRHEGLRSNQKIWAYFSTLDVRYFQIFIQNVIIPSFRSVGRFASSPFSRSCESTLSTVGYAVQFVPCPICESFGFRSM